MNTRGIAGNGGVGGWFGGGGSGLKGHRKSCFDGLKFFIKLTEKVKKRVRVCVWRCQNFHDQLGGLHSDECQIWTSSDLEGVGEGVPQGLDQFQR